MRLTFINDIRSFLRWRLILALLVVSSGCRESPPSQGLSPETELANSDGPPPSSVESNSSVAVKSHSQSESKKAAVNAPIGSFALQFAEGQHLRYLKKGRGEAIIEMTGFSNTNITELRTVLSLKVGSSSEDLVASTLQMETLSFRAKQAVFDSALGRRKGLRKEVADIYQGLLEIPIPFTINQKAGTLANLEQAEAMIDTHVKKAKPRDQTIFRSDLGPWLTGANLQSCILPHRLPNRPMGTDRQWSSVYPFHIGAYGDMELDMNYEIDSAASTERFKVVRFATKYGATETEPPFELNANSALELVHLHGTFTFDTEIDLIVTNKAEHSFNFAVYSTSMSMDAADAPSITKNKILISNSHSLELLRN